MIIPNAREEGPYNENNLNEKNKAEITGYDFAVEQFEIFMSNLEIYDFDVPGEDINIGRFFENHPEIAEKFTDAYKDYLESTRNELITSMIEGQEFGE